MHGKICRMKYPMEIRLGWIRLKIIRYPTEALNHNDQCFQQQILNFSKLIFRSFQCHFNPQFWKFPKQEDIGPLLYIHSQAFPTNLVDLSVYRGYHKETCRVRTIIMHTHSSSSSRYLEKKLDKPSLFFFFFYWKIPFWNLYRATSITLKIPLSTF